MERSPPKILVVEDDEALGQALQLAFSAEGLEIRVIGNAEGALVLLRGEPYDALITDKNLPGMSGVDLLRVISVEQPNLRTFMMTAYPSADAAMETLALGVVGFIEKPFD